MENIIDITVPMRSEMPVWPGTEGIRLTPIKLMEKGDPYNSSRLDCDLHTGTHVDAPSHFLADGTTVETLPLDVLVGPAFVAHLLDVEFITPEDLTNLNLSSDVKRLLLRTRNSELWATETTEFKKDFVALTPDAAQWIVDNGISLIGMDYLSVQRYSDDSITHEILLGAGTVALEGLNLSGVQSGFYELICLPLKLVGAEASPARVLLRKLESFYEKNGG